GYCQLRARLRICIIAASDAVNSGDKMHFDLAQIPTTDAYKLLVSTVVPRPIALATTVDSAGRVNAAPFSFFNAVSSVPPVVVLGISPGDAGGDGSKDTERKHPRQRRVCRQPRRRGVGRADEYLRCRFPAGSG